MPLLKRFDDDPRRALKASEKVRASALRMVKAEVTTRELLESQRRFPE